MGIKPVRRERYVSSLPRPSHPRRRSSPLSSVGAASAGMLMGPSDVPVPVPVPVPASLTVLEREVRVEIMPGLPFHGCKPSPAK